MPNKLLLEKHYAMIDQHAIAAIRRDYQLTSLLEKDVAANPIDQFSHWWHDALTSKIDEVNAMTLATVSAQGTPSVRVVLLKGYNHDGFVFFTNYLSAKGQAIAHNPSVALCFFWKELERQIRIEGTAKKLTDEDNDAYFNSRPAGSRLGAWSSPQSSIIENRQTIEENYLKYEEQFGVESIPRPPHWGGYIVEPTAIEFWQGRSSRLHDRILYQKEPDGVWSIARLAP